MKSTLGVSLLWFGIVVNWLVHLGALGVGIVFIVSGFRDDGIGTGFLYIFTVGVTMTIIHFLIAVISIPYMLLVNRFVPKE